ncbi:TetR family transcriptional regulator [Corynebacterium phocae]|uniref:TetR family transcriptional regulator n=1 Tax=Corynebacterium phocae TaxID=161895 RepID=A0A1L7D625_9CORY|nr:TetR/AcrR family transcriptional regulator [Corynebacterium phocae]APT93527.1 TetR family transcriptional regulator [Corynebacterium phocae]KAA8720609.1 TetR/AcrR family transcriptional regulator [Corynebacterium phocae]
MRSSNSSVSKGHRGRPGYSREDIIRAAVREFTNHGYEATSMGRVAKNLGITKSALYHHVNSKEEILELSVKKALDALETVVERAVADESPARDRLRLLVRRSVKVLCDDPASVALLLRLRGNSEAELEAVARRRQLTRQTVAIIAQAQYEKSIRHDFNQVLLGRMVYGLVNSVADWYRVDGRFSPDEVAEAVEAMLFEGMSV